MITPSSPSSVIMQSITGVVAVTTYLITMDTEMVTRCMITAGLGTPGMITARRAESASSAIVPQLPMVMRSVAGIGVGVLAVR